jgi:hypothetical protein
MADANADLDALDASDGKSGAPPKDERGRFTRKPAGEGEDKQPDDPEAWRGGSKDKPAAPGSAADKAKPPSAEAVRIANKDLREAYEGLRARTETELEPEVTRLRSRVAELEKGTAAPKEVQDRLAAAEKRAAELEQHIRYVDYAKSQEYQDKFWKPYVKAWSDATRELKGLTMQVQGEDGRPTVREVTDADLQYFASLDPAARRTEINRLFPEDKEEVKRHINEISRLFDASQTALAEARKQAETQSKTATETQRQAAAARAQTWKSTNEGLATKYPAWFAPTEGDAEGNALLDRGRALADLVFSPGDLKREHLDLLPKAFAETIRAGKPFTQEQLVRMHAIIRNKAANHDRLARKLTLAQTRVAELEESLKQYEASGPDGGRPARGGKGKTDFLGEANAELDAIDRKYA